MSVCVCAWCRTEQCEQQTSSTVADVEQLNDMIVNKPQMTMGVLALKLSVVHTTVARNLKNLGYHLLICDSLLRCNQNAPFLEQLVTGGEKWIVYNNAWKSILRDVLNYKLLPNKTITSEKLDHLKAATDEKWPDLGHSIVFHHGNDKTHTSIVTHQKLCSIEWDVLHQPLYLPDISPSNFHLFYSLQNLLNSKDLTSVEDCRLKLEEFINLKTPHILEE
ncbi:histone-lysine N-methyltransferase SETMAR-like [Schistocerca gregaria]|uniref:histone-lysine N-methyltransferase SETMAR-like n=1 Tax=Schistocerca gregaria TaxID=7010 RepID=UPI00211EC695|nr:histone-lysine N-methyltransferase SETMAR-like [Schistocerca gregaria]